MRCLCLFLCLLSLSLSLEAHESRPAHLQIKAQGEGILKISWTRPMLDKRVLQLHPIFPAGCTVTEAVRPYALQGLLHQRWTLDCGEHSLSGKHLSVSGLEATISDVLLGYQRQDGTAHMAILDRKNPVFVFPAQGALPGNISSYYLRLGVEHILGGVDHLLFVFLLLLLILSKGALIKTITAFTLGHSCTLAASVLGFVELPSAPVEALIVLSILLLARELSSRHEQSLSRTRPWLLAAIFGLVHGLGFAGALAEIGLPKTDIPLALFMFNIGVELGQILFVIFALLLMDLLRRVQVDGLDKLALVSTYAVGGIAAFWLIERVAGFY